MEHLGRAEQARAKPPVLEVRGLQVGTKLQDVSFTVCRAEILGVAGLAGSGRSTLLKALFGVVPRGAGDIQVSGKKVHLKSPGHAIKDGIYLIPEDRKTEGLVLSHSIEANLVASILRRLCVGPLINMGHSARVARETIEKFGIRPNTRCFSCSLICISETWTGVSGLSFTCTSTAPMAIVRMIEGTR